jgi:hypothetical protein
MKSISIFVANFYLCQPEQETVAGISCQNDKVNVQIKSNSIVHERYGREGDSGNEAYNI